MIGDAAKMLEPFNEMAQIEILFTKHLYGERTGLKFNYTVGNYSTGMTSLISKLAMVRKE